MKTWYKNPLIIGLILASIGWFTWVTRVAILSEGKAENSSVKAVEQSVKSIQELSGQKMGQICLDIAELKNLIKTHELNQQQQVEKIYSLMIQMSKDNKQSVREQKDKDIKK